MASGKELLKLAEAHIGEVYENVLVPKNNAKWPGPWDCAEFASWLVYQKAGKLYGCSSNAANPSIADAYSGAWARDAAKKVLTLTDHAGGMTIAGVILIRKPPIGQKMGHVAITDGKGGTVEAAGHKLGVRRDKVAGRNWDYYAMIPEITYTTAKPNVPENKVPYLLKLKDPNMSGPLVKAVQRALKAKGFNPGVIDGDYGPHTVAAVYAFQQASKLVADGAVGPKTAGKLGVGWINQ